MSYEEKGVWVSLVVGVLVYLGYMVVVLGRMGDGPVAEVAYVAPMLWSIGISVGLAVVGRIVVEIARPSERQRADARDRDINRFGDHVAGGVLGVGMVLPFGLALAEAPHFWIANAIYAVFSVWAVFGAAVKLVAYRRGF
ncbi:hypothetical protein B0I31_105498 [Saccharothrix carnea]|uniref:DUF2178 domain-containing protein n=1 Tax=Saccharothrix carnea TaxID=1280637 RepID=A0A2P8IAP2_SACCR|nr:hypothetical protein [Saccharothrix carnea]PSL55532.1 hypothetical protein B0I31_105498 [Saccharothrix carnea]